MQRFFARAAWRILAVLIIGGGLLQGCGSSNDQETFYVARAINLVTDSPSQAIDIGDLNFQLTFGIGSGYSSAFAGSGEFEVRAFVPGASPADTFEDTLVLRAAETVEFADKTSYTVINYGTIADFRSLTVVAPIPETADPANIQVQFVHAAKDAGSVDVYMTAPGADLSGGPTFAALAEGQVSAIAPVALSDYQVRITATGSTDVIYDSGTITRIGSGQRMFVIGRTVGPTPVPVFLSRWSSQGGPLAIADNSTPTFARLLHLTPGAGAMDLYAENDYLTAVASNIGFGAISAYGAVSDTRPDPVRSTASVTIDFEASASDSEDGELTDGIVWASSIDGVLDSSAGLASTTLSTGEHSVYASVTDAGGLTGTEVISVSILAEDNAAPDVSISRPPDRPRLMSGTAVTFEAIANDSVDGDLTPGLVWTSSIDGTLMGTGGSLTATLSPGTHAITASVADSGGLTGAATVVVDITTNGNTAPTVAIGSPDTINAIEFDVTLTSNSDTALLQDNREVSPGNAYTVAVIDPGTGISGALLSDFVQKVATNSLVRFLNSSELAGSVDIYLTVPGASITGQSPFVSNLAAGAASGVGGLAAEDYDITVTAAGTSDVVLLIPSVSFSNLQSNTIALVDDDANMVVDFVRLSD